MKIRGMTPRSIVSDHDLIFMSVFWREFFELHGTELKTSSAYHSQTNSQSSAYHPQTNGQTEVINRCLEHYLRCFTSQQPKKWEQFLAWAKFWYNTTFHHSIGTTPFQAFYGRPPPFLINYFIGSSPASEVDKNLRNRDEVLQELKSNLDKANNRMKQYADAHHREEKFQVGDWVYIKLQPHHQSNVFRRVHRKLASKILAVVGGVAYKLQLPDQSRIQPIFHVSFMHVLFFYLGYMHMQHYKIDFDEACLWSQNFKSSQALVVSCFEKYF